MKAQFATGFLPYELEDVVRLKNGELVTITDIKMVQTIRDKKVWFEVEVEGESWINLEDIKEIIKD